MGFNKVAYSSKSFQFWLHRCVHSAQKSCWSPWSGKRRLATLTFERRKLMITILCFRTFSYLPRKCMKPDLLDGVPAGFWGESGWIQRFVLWLKRFIKWSHSIKDNPSLLLLGMQHTLNLLRSLIWLAKIVLFYCAFHLAAQVDSNCCLLGLWKV